MSELQNARYEKFSVLVAQADKPAGQCYEEAGFSPKSRSVADAAASRLLKNVMIERRIIELKAKWASEAGATTTSVIKVLRATSEYDIADIMDWRWVGKGRRRRLVMEVKDLRDISPLARMAIRSAKPTAHGVEIVFTDRVPGQRLVGQHLGMFQGETASSATLIDNSKHITFVDAPRQESYEEWEARIAKRRGLPVPK